MGKYKKLFLQILQGGSDANVGFDDLCNLLERLGFDVRVKGSHHLFDKDGLEELVNLQRHGKDAKAYQVRQVRAIIVRHKLTLED